VKGSSPAGIPPVLALLVAASLTLMTLDRLGPASAVLTGGRAAARQALSPLQAAGEAAVRPLGELAGGLSRAGALRRENARLRREVTELRSQAARAEALGRENALLAGALGLVPVDGAAPPVAARVVSLPNGRAGSTFVVDRGSEAGVRPGMPVMASGALVGRVVRSSRGWAAVLPLADPTSAVGIRLSGSGETGLAEGAGRSAGLRLDLLDPAVAVAPGELAVTSGLRHGRFPPGLPVGRVAPASQRGEVRLRPLAELGRLEIVQVLRWEAPA